MFAPGSNTASKGKLTRPLSADGWGQHVPGSNTASKGKLTRQLNADGWGHHVSHVQNDEDN